MNAATNANLDRALVIEGLVRSVVFTLAGIWGLAFGLSTQPPALLLIVACPVLAVCGVAGLCGCVVACFSRN